MSVPHAGLGSTLPLPIGRQKEVLCLPANGHTVVLGTAGSGKTTLAVLRALYLVHPDTDHAGRTLLVTFNRCLVTYLKSLAGAIPKSVEVQNYHLFARGYLNARGRMRNNCIATPELQRSLCNRAVVAARADGVTSAILQRPVEFLVDEMCWLAQHGIRSAADYVEAERINRAGTRVLRAERPVMFNLYERYQAIRTAAGLDYDWDDLSHAVLEELHKDDAPRYYRHVVIDEGQDLSPMILRSLAAAIPDDGSLTFFGDMAQQIYGNKMSWRTAGLQVDGVWHFEENYRNSKQIAELALAIAAMPLFSRDPDLVVPKSPAADGPLPALVSFGTEADEIRFVANLVNRVGQSQRVAVLFRDRAAEHALLALLPQGMVHLHRDLKHWPDGPGIFYGTYHAAKGLEFDMVVLPMLSNARLPHPPDVETFGERDASTHDLSLLYVAVTRARTNLVMTHAGERTSLLPCADALYQLIRR